MVVKTEEPRLMRGAEGTDRRRGVGGGGHEHVKPPFISLLKIMKAALNGALKAEGSAL